MASESADNFDERSSGSEWNDSEIAAAIAAIAASVCVIGAVDYYRRFCIKSNPAGGQIERDRFISRIIRKSDRDCLAQLRMSRGHFFELCSLLRDRNLLFNNRRCMLEEQVVMFLHTIGHNVRNRVIGHRFTRFGETVSRHFIRVLDAIIGLYPEYVKFPGLHTLKEISDNPLWSPYFQDCIGALDGTHILAHLRKESSSTFRNRKGFLSQNVLAACTFDMKFVYVLAGWDGSASDARVLQNALTRRPDCFLIPHGKYYVVDAGYAHTLGFMAPYRGVRYHLNEFRTGRKPANKKELFNYRHAQLRNVIERAFGLLKGHFPILRTTPQFKFKTQVKIVIACCVLHNFLRVTSDDGLVEEVEDSGDSTMDVSPSAVEVTTGEEGQALARVMNRARDDWTHKRDEIAERMWNDNLPRTRQRSMNFLRSTLKDTKKKDVKSSPSKRVLLSTQCPTSPAEKSVTLKKKQTPAKTCLSPRNVPQPKRSVGGSSRVSRIQWTDSMDNALVDALVGQVNLGLRSDVGFKPKAYKATIKEIYDACGILLENRHILNRLRTLKKLYWAIKDMLNASGFGWDDSQKMVIATEDVWEGYIAIHPYEERVRGKHVDRWDDLAFMFGNDIAHGQFASTAYSSPISGRRHGRDELNSDDESEEEPCQTVRLSSSDEDERKATPRFHSGEGSVNRAKRTQKSPMEATSCSRHSRAEGSEFSCRKSRPSEQIEDRMGEVTAAVNNLTIIMAQRKRMLRVQRLLGILKEVDGLSSEDQIRAARVLQDDLINAGFFLKWDMNDGRNG